MARWQPGSRQRGSGNTGERTWRWCAAAALAASLAPASSWALFDDHAEVWAAENVTHDSNVLRISKDVDPATLGATQRGDWINTTTVGASGDANFSQQHVTGQASYFRSNYHYFNDFDFNGYSALVNWAWVLNPEATGTLGASDAKSLSNFSSLQVRIPDVVTTRAAYATGLWNITPRWRANGELHAEQNRHSADIDKVNDINLETALAGLSYVTPRDDSFGGYAHVEHGKSPSDALFNGIPFDNSYQQHGFGAMLTYIATVHSRIDARAEYMQRTYEQQTSRNYGGPIGRVLYIWTPTPKFTLNALLQRDVGPPEDITAAFVLVTGGYVRPKWQITEKLTLTGNLEYEVWDYRGDPLGLANFTHHQRLFGVSLAYSPTRRILLQAGWNHEKRTSTLPLADYDVDVVFIEGRIGF